MHNDKPAVPVRDDVPVPTPTAIRPPPRDTWPGYAELHCLSAFSFGRGASSADELFARGKQLGYQALAITDECSLAGIVRALEASKQHGLALITGSEFQLACGLKLVLLCQDMSGYQTLCGLITTARRRSEKGHYELRRADINAVDSTGLLALWPLADPHDEERDADARWLKQQFPSRVWLAIELHRETDDHLHQQHLLTFAHSHDLPCVATGDVHMHVRERRALQDVLTAIRLGTPVAQAGRRLFANGERHLRTRKALTAIHGPELLAESLRIAAMCRFSLRDLHYRYPKELVPRGHTPTSWLRHLVEQGLRQRWPAGEPEKVRRQIENELEIITSLNYEDFFLTVEDIVRFARNEHILCQGRGSAANSAVCFVLGITAVNPEQQQLLFGRFLSKERKEPPDIDVDFEHDRREEVIQYVYGKYGRERAALAATVIRWQGRSAARAVAAALGLSTDQQQALSQALRRGHDGVGINILLREQGFDPQSPVINHWWRLTRELIGLPRHLSQHVGGFVIADQPLSHLVPVENAAMPERSIIQWDKDDLEELRLLKVDVLALGMLSCLRRGLALIEKHTGVKQDLADIPAGDTATYAMLQRADSIGVFQVESRAQMSMLPRLKPQTFYDLVIQVAIVRPGPIQGGMVHPYLRRRSNVEEIDYPRDELRPVLERTLGIPIFQEQVMELSMVAAGFNEGQADQLRRSMAAWKRRGGLEPWRDKIMAGMAERGYPVEFAERIFEQIKGFGDYGFPESHAASFALLAYASAWMKCHHPAIFTAALLNSLPMGFYAPAQLIADARRHQVTVLPVDVLSSDFDCVLEAHARSAGGLALRLGFRLANGLGQEAMERLMAARQESMFQHIDDLVARAQLDRRNLQALADAGALRRLAGHRHRAQWAVTAAETLTPHRMQQSVTTISDRKAQMLDGRSGGNASSRPRTGDLLLVGSSHAEDRVRLRPPDAHDSVHADYASLGFSLDRHPLSLLRGQLRQRRVLRAIDLQDHDDGTPVRVAGLVTVRQRPGTASGVTFVTLEDETGLVNLIVWQHVARRYRRELLESRLMAVAGRLQFADNVRHVIAERLVNGDDWLPMLQTASRDFH